MASNNLRIIYKNIVDLPTTTVTASSQAATSVAASNLKLDNRLRVWRSSTSTTTAVKANLLITSSTPQQIGGICLVLANLSSTATIRVRGFTGTTPVLAGTVDAPTVTTTGATTQYDTGNVSCVPYTPVTDWYNTTVATSYLSKTYARVWLSPANQAIACTSWVIEIIDTITNKYVEVSKLVMGSYWSPKFNTSYGVSSGIVDLTKSERTEAGDIVVYSGAHVNTLSFDLKWMNSTDRDQFNTLIKTIALKRNIYVSIFPENSSDYGLEGIYQIYGKFNSISGIEHNILSMFSSKVELEEF